WNSDGNMIYNGFGFSTSATLINQWSGYLGGGVSTSEYSDRLLRGGPLAKNPASYQMNGGFNTDSRRLVWVNPSFFLSRSVTDPSWNAQGSLYFDSRPSTSLHITFGPSYSRSFSS